MNHALTLEQLRSMAHRDLVPAWRAMFGTAPPKRMSAALMRRILAYEIQARADRPLDKRTRDKLARIARDQARPRSTSLAPGGRLIREWNGETYEVEVLETGFALRGNTYRSLSAVAEAITGVRWSGPRFFGLGKGAP